MKVYVCIKEKGWEGDVAHMNLIVLERMHIGDLFVEPKGKKHDYLKWGDDIKKERKWQSYVSSRGYPKSRELIEDNPEYFKLLIDDEINDTDYYVTKKYSQYEVDELLKK